MGKIVMRNILVIGDDHENIVKKYSADTKVEKYVKMTLSQAKEEQLKQIKLFENLFKILLVNEETYEILKEEYLKLKNMPTEVYFLKKCEGCEIDTEKGIAYSDVNENAYYKYERCNQKRLLMTGEEGDFSDPFPLKDGTKSYSAHFNDIDWKKIHRNPKYIELNSRLWDMVVNDDTPRNDKEEVLKTRMKERISYFVDNFKNKEEYVNHSCSLWYWGIATEERYDEVDYTVSDMDWVVNFFDKYIKPLKETNPLITIYEVRCLD